MKAKDNISPRLKKHERKKNLETKYLLISAKLKKMQLGKKPLISAEKNKPGPSFQKCQEKLQLGGFSNI